MVGVTRASRRVCWFPLHFPPASDATGPGRLPSHVPLDEVHPALLQSPAALHIHAYDRQLVSRRPGAGGQLGPAPLFSTESKSRLRTGVFSGHGMDSDPKPVLPRSPLCNKAGGSRTHQVFLSRI